MICIYVYSISASMLICVSEQNAPEKLIFDTLNMNIWNVNYAYEHCQTQTFRSTDPDTRMG